jgi:predicted SAM-dependent methyltransferase
MSALVTRLKRTESPSARMAMLRAAATVRYATHGHVVRTGRIRRYLESAEDPKLHLGAGRVRLPGWLNTDLISGDVHLDVGRRLPLPDASFTYAFGEHLIEHLTQKAAGRMLAEVRRVLRPGGVLRLTTPDLRKIVALYEDQNPAVSRGEYAAFLEGVTGKRYEHGSQILNDQLRLWGHRHIYDEEELEAKLREAGFESIQGLSPGDSTHEALRGVESHGGAEWVNRAEAMCLEGTAPRH